MEITIGQDTGTAEAVEKLGATHIKTTHGEVIFDEKNILFTTPCYMLDANILDIAKGASNIVKAMLDYIQSHGEEGIQWKRVREHMKTIKGGKIHSSVCPDTKNGLIKKDLIVEVGDILISAAHKLESKNDKLAQK